VIQWGRCEECGGTNNVSLVTMKDGTKQWECRDCPGSRDARIDRLENRLLTLEAVVNLMETVELEQARTQLHTAEGQINDLEMQLNEARAQLATLREAAQAMVDMGGVGFRGPQLEKRALLVAALEKVGGK